MTAPPPPRIYSAAELSAFSRLVDMVYEGATAPERWDQILPALAGWLGAPRAWLFTPMHVPAAGGFSFTHAFTASMEQTWRDKWHKQDLWAMRAMEMGRFVEGKVWRSDEILPDSAIVSTEVYREFMLPHKIHHLLSGIVFGPSSTGMLPAACSLFRGVDESRFDADDSERLNLLLPHISRALGVAQRLRDADLKVAASLAALDKLQAGVLLIGRNRAVSFANRAARRLLAEEDGLALRHHAGRASTGELIMDDRRAADATRAAIIGAIDPDILATEHFCRFVSVPRPSGRAPYTLNFSSLPEHNEFSAGHEVPRVIVFITDSTAPVAVDGALLQHTYGLTPAEIRVAVAMAEGLT